ncbi:large conductance mechanosensitive channel protein MscL [Brachybacterium endophyticum]|uniref:Large-conductance mechanosensitive channel n=1 Tax=Brachybacterium endophyticum TaxID=2182385 RepID=A0A2U2RM50_9MICO|nr:large conductance mechanosensitive channel protein MscL [Brachybacterium endophyticum]PWH06949.1 large conductance mechanosensitive channel protein MscL [Brachybacterium endophyticum]
MKGFKEFVMQGNVIDLAVGVVIGGAFTALVTAFVNFIINPIVAAAGGADSIGLGFHVIGTNDKTFVNIGEVISAVITFLITAAVVYFVFVLPMAKARRMAAIRRGEDPDAEPTSPEDVLLLTEIRDLLQQQNASGTAGGPTGGTQREL